MSGQGQRPPNPPPGQGRTRGPAPTRTPGPPPTRTPGPPQQPGPIRPGPPGVGQPPRQQGPARGPMLRPGEAGQSPSLGPRGAASSSQPPGAPPGRGTGRGVQDPAAAVEQPPVGQRPRTPSAPPTPSATPTQMSQRPMQPDTQHGRAVYRADHRAAPRPASATSGDLGGATASVAGMTLGNGSTATGGSAVAARGSNNGGNGNNGAGSASSQGRGATRGGGREVTGLLFRTRPDGMASKTGVGGAPIQLMTNYFNVVQRPNWVLMQYRVDIDPEEDRIGIRKALVYELIPQIGGQYVFDGTMMFTIKRLDPDPLVLTATLNPRSGGDTIRSRVTFRRTGEVTPNDVMYIHVMNIILRKALGTMNLQEIRRDYFDPHASVKFDRWNIEVWPGYKTTIRQHEHSLLLSCDTTCKILRTDTVYDQIRKILSENRNDRVAVERQMMGQIVMTKYNKKTYKVDNIVWDKAPTDTFPTRNGEISFMEYYRTKHDVTIKDPKQPMLLSKPRDSFRRQDGQEVESVLLIPELCIMTGLSEEQRNNFTLMKDIGNLTRAAPQSRVQLLQKFAKRIKDTAAAQAELKNWGVKFDDKLQTFPARLFPPEIIRQGNQRLQCSYKADNAEWGFGRGFKLFNAVPCSKWMVIYPRRDEKDTRDFLGHLETQATTLGFIMGKPLVKEIPDFRTSTYVAELARLIPMKPHMIMVFVPNKNGDQYHAIKKTCYVENAIPSQVITAQILRKPQALPSIAAKVAVQMASKLGGEPWAMDIPLSDTMIIGYDSYHDTVNSSKSIGAVVATTNQSLTRFHSTVTVHTNNDELHLQMKQSIAKALRAYGNNNGGLPKRILIYRDGVGDGQIQYVLDTEVNGIREVLRANYQTMPHFGYIIVSKRINTRFFAVGGPAPSNPPSGTIVDDVVTLPERYDFFLVSQSVRQGTVNPTSYNVICDETKLKPEHIQRLTYKLCHMYYNWPGTVRVPSVCQYAHKLAFLVGNSLHRQPHAELENLLYYL